MKILQKRQSSKGVFEGVVHFQRSLRKFTASGFLLYEIDFPLSRKLEKQIFFPFGVTIQAPIQKYKIPSFHDLSRIEVFPREN